MTEPKNPEQAEQAKNPEQADQAERPEQANQAEKKRRRRHRFAIRGAAKMARALERRGALRLRW